MIHLLILAVHLLATIAKLVRPGGVRAVVAESLVAKAPVAHQQPRTTTGTESEFVRSLPPGSWITVRVKPDGDKTMRMAAQAASIEAGAVYLPNTFLNAWHPATVKPLEFNLLCKAV